MRLVVFPHAGGGRLFYRNFESSFKKLEMSVIQYPGREEKLEQDMPHTVGELADELFNEYRSLFDSDYVIWGHSMGSTVGYEVAKRCEEILHNPPIAFFSSGADAPCKERTEKEKSAMTCDKDFEDLLELYGGISDDLRQSKEFCDYFYPIIRGDMKLLFNYIDSDFVKLHCPIKLIEGTEDDCEVNKWKYYTNYDVDVKYHKGGHFFITDHKNEIAAYIEKNAMEFKSRTSGMQRRFKIT